MSDRDLIGRLMLTLLMDEPFDRQSLFNQPLFQPAAREMQDRTLSGQSLTELRDKCR